MQAEYFNGAVSDRFKVMSHDLFGNVEVDFGDGSRAAQAYLESASLGACRVSRLKASPHHAIFGRRPRQSFDPDSIKMIFQFDGKTVHSRDGLDTIQTAGTWIAYDPMVKYRVQHVTRVHQAVVQIPRHNFSQAALRQLQQHRLLANSDVGLARIATELVRCALDESDRLDEAMRTQIGATLVGFATTLIFAGDAAAANDDSHSHSILRERVQAFIAANLCAEDLDIERIAEKMGCSRRSIFLAFEDAETTPAKLVWDMRLDLARDRLKSAAFRQASVAEVAYSCGFASGAHFSRAFKKRFGLSPSEMRSIS